MSTTVCNVLRLKGPCRLHVLDPHDLNMGSCPVFLSVHCEVLTKLQPREQKRRSNSGLCCPQTGDENKMRWSNHTLVGCKALAW